jgi:hypothetical protein
MPRLVSVTVRLPPAIIQRGQAEATGRGLALGPLMAEIVEVWLADRHLRKDQQPGDARRFT